MEPTLMTGQRFVINKMAYVVRPVRTGDIISFRHFEPESGATPNYTKRVVGVAGDEISFKNGYVYLNGEILNESAYLDEDVETNCMKTFTVPDGCVFVMGDDREFSIDSRYWDDPYVPVDTIIGKYLFTIPFTN